MGKSFETMKNRDCLVIITIKRRCKEISKIVYKITNFFIDNVFIINIDNHYH